MGCGAPVLGGLTPSTFPCRIHVTIDQAAPRAPEFVETLAGAIEVLTNGKLPRVRVARSRCKRMVTKSV